jgi:hypothetical protein
MSFSNDSTIAYCSVESPEELYSLDIPEDRYGYRQISDKFVPISLLERIEYHLIDRIFDACSVLSPHEMVRKEFWESLSEGEKDILPACLFQFIGEGRITFTVPE